MRRNRSPKWKPAILFFLLWLGASATPLSAQSSSTEEVWINSRTHAQRPGPSDRSPTSPPPPARIRAPEGTRAAVQIAGLSKPATCYTLRYSFAPHTIQDGYDIRTIHELLGHRDVNTTMIYTHVLNRGGRDMRSPVDR